MDIISKGDFSISNYGGRTIFSFRSPSMASTDYAKQIKLLEQYHVNKLSRIGALFFYDVLARKTAPVSIRHSGGYPFHKLLDFFLSHAE